MQARSRKKRFAGKRGCILSSCVESSRGLCQVQKLHEGN